MVQAKACLSEEERLTRVLHGAQAHQKAINDSWVLHRVQAY